jgi:1-acylglycerone phosphate reductase
MFTANIRIATYNATKAALIVAGEGWRLELAPLGVRVITLITGGVATNFLANLQPLTLPEDSYYMGIEDIIAEHPEDIPLAMKTDKYALEVVNCVEKGMSGKHWIGGGSVVARLAMWMMPQFALVSFAGRGSYVVETNGASCRIG